MALYYVFQSGYYFNRMDQEECLPLVYKMKNPALYAGDLYMDHASQGIGIRYFFARLVHFVSEVMSVEHACFLLHVLCTATCAFFIMRLTALLFSGNLWARLLAPFLAIGKYSFWVVGGNSYIDNQLVPQSVAVAIGTAAVYQLFRKKYRSAALLCGLSSLFQPLVGLQLMTVSGAVLLFSGEKKKLLKLVSAGAIYLVAAAPLLLPQALHRQPVTTPADKQLFTEVYFFFRNRHHYVPDIFPGGDWLRWGGLVALALLLLLLYRHPARKILFCFGATILAGMAVYSLLLYAGLAQVMYTQWFKTSMWLECLASLVIAGYVGKGLEALLHWARLRWWHYGLMSLAAIFLFLVVWGTPVTDLVGRRGWYELNDHPKTDLTLLHEWVRDHTPVSSRILSVPRDESALCEMQRPLVFSHKAIIPEAWFMARWYRLYQALYAPPGLDITRARKRTTAGEVTLYRQRPDSFYLRQTSFDYRIIYTDSLQDSSRIVRYQGAYALRKCR